MLLIQTAYQKVKGLGLPSVVVLRILGGVLDVRANGAGVGLEARRRFCPPCGVGQWFISGRSLANLIMWRCEPGNQPSNQLRKFEILLSSSCVTNTWKTGCRAVSLSGDARSPGRYRGKVSRLRYSGVARSYFYSSKGARLRSSGP